MHRDALGTLYAIHLLTLVMLVLQTDHYLNWMSLKVFFLSHLVMKSSVYFDNNDQ